MKVFYSLIGSYIHKIQTLFFVGFSILFFSSLLIAQPVEQSGELYILEGYIYNSNDNGIMGAAVSVEGRTGIRAVSAIDGRYELKGIPSGEHTIVYSKKDYGTLKKKVNFGVNKKVRHDVIMEAMTSMVVVTGTQSEKDVENSPVPTMLITKEEIENSGSVKLTEILAEQMGLSITNFLGEGVQIQGLDPDYTLILIDGEPIIGRNGGTLDLSRVSLGNVERIEVVKGASSSLYGSEALAGVVNIITAKPEKGFKTNVRGRIGTHNTLDVNGDIEYRKDGLGVFVFLNRNSSGGYDLTPQSISQTGPQYYSYTVNPKLTYDFGKFSSLSLSGRYYTENLSNFATVIMNNSQSLLDNKSNLYDWNIMGSFTHRFSPMLRIKSKAYFSRYNYKNILTYVNNGALFYEDKFDQRYNKGEVSFDTYFLKENITSIGGGVIVEEVKADRIYEGERRATNIFGFVQDEWIPSNYLDIIGGVRFDAHSDYDSKFSPKLSLLYKPYDWGKVRASYGTGFKAPTFQQLYLDFTNAQVGYSVFGTYGFEESFRRLQENGEISTILIAPNTVQEIKPENSTSYNFGVDISPYEFVSLNIGVFRNDVRDLINVQPVAKKTNGQSVFTYFNVARVYTQGVEAELIFKPVTGFLFSVGYQYLDAKDKDVIDQIENEKISKFGATGFVRPVQPVEYGGLFNRSKNSGVIKIMYDNRDAGFGGSIRGIFRGRYGYKDLNSNLILDDDTEYAPGYILWNVALMQNIMEFFDGYDTGKGGLKVQLGINNVFDKINPAITPEIPGRIFYAGINAFY